MKMSTPTNYNIINASSLPMAVAPDNANPAIITASKGTSLAYTYSPFPTTNSMATISSEKGSVKINLKKVAADYDAVQIIDVAQGSYTDYIHGTLQLGPVTALGNTNGSKILNIALSPPVACISWSGSGTGTLKQVNGDKYFLSYNDSPTSGNNVSFLWFIILMVIIIIIIVIALVVAIIVKKKKAKAKQSAQPTNT